MNILLFNMMFLSKENLQRPVINYLRNNVITNMNTNILKENDISWEKSNNYKNIVKKYFYNYDVKNNINKYENSYAELFKIYGVPACAVIINKENNNVENFILNKNLMLMYDAGPLCRYSFYKNYKKYNIKNALHKNEFLII
tara:strand:- start:221 stop:646 length:426 start_codon:yes stop_codon:yes gene_type:complete